MSFLINWDRVMAMNPEILRTRIQSAIDSRPLPETLLRFQITSIDVGSVAPEVELIDISEPLPAFTRPPRFPQSSSMYNINSQSQRSASMPPRSPMPAGVAESVYSASSPGGESNESDGSRDNSSPTAHMQFQLPSPIYQQQHSQVPTLAVPLKPRPSHPFDTQCIVNFRYAGDLSIGVDTEVALNTPSPAFLSLPVRMRVTNWNIEASFVVAYLVAGARVVVSIVGRDDVPVEFDGRDDVIREPVFDFKSEWEVGDSDKPVLRNANKIERFMNEVVVKLLHDHLIYPLFHTVNLYNPSEVDFDEDAVD